MSVARAEATGRCACLAPRHARVEQDQETGLTPDHRPPGWLDLIVRCAAFAVVAFGLAGLPLALLGELRPRPTAAGALLVFLLLHLLWWSRSRTDRADRRRPTRAGTGLAVLAVLLAVGSGVLNGSQHYEHLIVDGDPAVYSVTGALLARTGELTVPTREQELFGGNETVAFAGSGYFNTGDEPSVYPQFFHLLPVLLAAGSWLGGTSLLLLVNPVLGAFSLLAFYAFAARVVRPGWALLSTAALAVLLPQLHFSRDSFSEIPSQLLVFAGLALLWDVTGSRRPTGWPAVAGGLVTGLVLGGSAMARIDAFLYLVPLAVGLLIVRAGWTGLAVATGAGVSAAVALVDGYVGSPVYVESVEGPLLQTAAALVLVAVAAVVVRRSPAWVPRVGAGLAWPVAGITVALAAFAWFVRPSVQVTRRIPGRTNETIASLQAAEGLPVDVPRSYDELTMVWLSWYLGPAALAIGVLGLAWLSWRVLRGRDLRLAPFVLLLGLATAVYVWHPGIFPVQYWASRRFLPVTFPGLLLAAVWACAVVWDRWPDWRRVLPVVAGASVLAFPLALLPGATLPRSYQGLEQAVVQMCGSLLPSDVVLLVGGAPVTDGLLQPVQGYCGVVAGAASKATTTEDVEEVAAAAQAAGRRLVLLSPVPDPEVVPDASFREIFDVTMPTPALSLSKRPDEVYDYRLRLFLAIA